MSFISFDEPEKDSFVDFTKPQEPEKKSSFLRRAADVPLGLVKGVVDLPGAVTGVVDTFTGGSASAALDPIIKSLGEASDTLGLPSWVRPTQWSQGLRDSYSPETKAALQGVETSAKEGQAEAKDSGEGAFGQILGSAKGAAKGILENPSSVIALAAENYGGMKAISMGVAKFIKPMSLALDAQVSAGKMTAEAANKILGDAAAKASAIGEGVLTVGQTGQSIQRADPDADFIHRLAAIPAGVITGSITRGASKIPGLGDVEASMATASLGKSTGFAGSLPVRVGKGVLSEGFIEELPQSAQEQVWQNIGASKPWQEDVGSQAVQGAVSGGLLGGGMAGLHGASADAKPAEPTPDRTPEIFNAPDVDSAINAAERAIAESITQTTGADLFARQAQNPLQEAINRPAEDQRLAPTNTQPDELLNQQLIGANPLMDIARAREDRAAVADQIDQQVQQRKQSEVDAIPVVAAEQNTVKSAVERAATLEAPTALEMAFQRAREQYAPAEAIVEQPAKVEPQKPTEPAIEQPRIIERAPGLLPMSFARAEQVAAKSPELEVVRFPNINRDTGEPNGKFSYTVQAKVDDAQRIPAVVTSSDEAQSPDAKAVAPIAGDDVGQGQPDRAGLQLDRVGEFTKSQPQVPEAAPVSTVARVPALDDVRPPKENLKTVVDSLSNSAKVIGNKTVSIDSLNGGVGNEVGDQNRVKALADKLTQEGSFIERLVVDDAGNVIEGQHRLDALKMLGVKEVPVVVIQDFQRNFPTVPVSDAIRAAQPIHSDNVNQLASSLAEIYSDESGDIAEIRQYEAPKGFEKAWNAGIDALERESSNVENSSPRANPQAEAPRTEAPKVAAVGTDEAIPAARQPAAGSAEVQAAGVTEFEKSKEGTKAAMAAMKEATERKNKAAVNSIEYGEAQRDIQQAWVDVARVNLIGFPYKSGPEYEARLKNLSDAESQVDKTNKILDTLRGSADPKSQSGNVTGLANEQKGNVAPLRAEQPSDVAQPAPIEVSRFNGKFDNGMNPSNARIEAVRLNGIAQRENTGITYTAEAHGDPKLENPYAVVGRKAITGTTNAQATEAQQSQPTPPTATKAELTPAQRSVLADAIGEDLEIEYQAGIKHDIQRRLGRLPAPKEIADKQSPFKAFLKTHGISDSPSDVVGEGNAFRANQILPSVFRRGGLGMDELAIRAEQNGFITQADIDSGDANGKLVEMVRNELRGEKQLPMGMQDDAAQVANEKNQRQGIESIADGLGLPYDADTPTDRLASMVARIERILAQPRTGLLKADRILRNAREKLARIEAKRAQFEAQFPDFDEAITAEQDAVLDVLIDEDGLPVIIRTRGIDVVEQAERESKEPTNDARANPDSGQDKALAERVTPEGVGNAQENGTSEQRRSNQVEGQQEGLVAPSREDILAQQDRADAATKQNESQRLAADKIARDEEDRKRIAKASEAAAGTFELGGNALDNLTGQGDIFSAPAEKPASEMSASELLRAAADKMDAAQKSPPAQAKRTNPTQTIEFKNPIVGPSGEKLLSYTWQWKPFEYVDKTGEERTGKLSDWDKSAGNVDTGRNVVHQFTVENKAGETRIVSAESAIAALGYADKAAEGSAKSVIAAVKTLARNKMQLAELESALSAFTADQAEVNNLDMPGVVQGENGWWSMGDATVRQTERLFPDSKPGELLPGRMKVLEEGWRSNRMTERGWNLATENTLKEGIYNTKAQIKRAQAKLDAIAPVSQPAQDSGLKDGQAKIEYPLAPAGTRYEETSKPITMMTPDAYLAAVRPLDIDEASRDNIDDLKAHILSGKKLDPLHIRADGKEDGRHRAVAAKELGIAKVPVVDDRPAAVKSESAKIENFGEELPPARRTIARQLSEDLTDDAIAKMPLSQVWPASENDAIEDPFIAAAAHVMREAIPSKPRTAYKVKTWVQNVQLLRSTTALLVSGRIERERFIEKMSEGRYYALRNLLSKIKLLEKVDRAQWGRIGDVQEWPDAMQYDQLGNKVSVPQAVVTIDDKIHNLKNSGDLNDHMDAITALLSGEAKEKRMAFEIRGRSNSFFINKTGDKQYRHLMEFTSAKEASNALENRYEEVVAAWEAVKEQDNITERDLRAEDNRPRSGKDWRNGKDVSAEDFQKQFGFKGGEFGKWVSQGKGAQERQFFLNSSYDALMDLADIVGIPPDAISLEGTLGIAFGSRGNGWASAHFEPSNLVINLTKPRGAGSLAHEWFHALDNYFARKRGGEVPMNGSQVEYRNNNYLTHRTTPMMVRKDGRGTPTTRERLAEWRKSSPGAGYLAADQWIEDPKHKQGVRAEVEERFENLVKALSSSPMAKRARVLDGVKENGDGYWSRTLELAARSFENYVQSRMLEQGYHNDFLANVRDAVETGKNLERYPYLMPSEIAPVADAFASLFNTIQTKETERGTMLFSRSGAQSRNGEKTRFTRAWYDRLISLLPESYRGDSYRREPLPPEGRDVQRTREVQGKVDALNQELRGPNDTKGYGPVSIDALGNLQVDARQAGFGDVVGGVKALADEIGYGVVVTGVRANRIQMMRDAGFESEISLAAVADRLTGALEREATNITDVRDTGTIMSYKPRGFPMVLFSFAGQNAATANKFNLDSAQSRIDAGDDAETVRKDTGWHKGVDGKWRFEISDADATLTMPYKAWSKMVVEKNGGPMPYSEATGTGKYPRVKLSSVLNHPMLFEAYPALADFNVFYDISLGPSGPNAFIDELRHEIGLNTWKTDSATLSSLLHEVQHGIQKIEGFATGGSADAFRANAYKLGAMKDLEDQISELRKLPWTTELGKKFTALNAAKDDRINNPYRSYTRLAGEVESRNTQARQNLTDAQRRDSPPRETADVADSDVIVTFNGQDALSAPPPANAIVRTQAIQQAAPLTPITTIREALSSAYGKLSSRLEAKGLLTIHQTQDEALQAAAQARADVRGTDAKTELEGMGGLQAATVWHGSPHKFDAFDSSKIGTGEGNQSYGHGLYLAESPGVAKAYSDGTNGIHVNGKRFDVAIRSASEDPTQAMKWKLVDQGMDEKQATVLAAAMESANPKSRLLELAEKNKQNEYGEIAKTLHSNLDTGSLYKVDLPDEAIAKMLDWDKPLSEQPPEVQKALASIANGKMTGEQAWKAAIRESGNPLSSIAKKTGQIFSTPQEAADNLQRLGIPGIRYLDGVSRARTDGELIDVSQKNGQWFSKIKKTPSGQVGDVIPMAPVVTTSMPFKSESEARQWAQQQIGGGTSNYVVFPGNEHLLDIQQRNGIDIKRSADGHMQGFHDTITGKSFLVSDHLTAETAPGVLIHEIGVHAASDGALNPMHDRASELVSTDKSDFMREVAKRMDAAGETTGEEAAAYITEAYENNRLNAPKSVRQWIKDYIAAIRGWLYKKGILIAATDLTPADIAAIARANARQVAKDGAVMGEGGLSMSESGESLSPGEDFWRKIKAGESFAEKELEDVYSQGRRGTERAMSRMVGKAVEMGAGPGEEIAAWAGTIAGFDGYRTVGVSTGEGTFIVGVIPEEIFRGGDSRSVRETAIVTYEFTPDGDKYRLDVGDPLPTGDAFAEMQDRGTLESTGDRDSDGQLYFRAKLEDRYTTSRALLQESVRRLALHAGKVPTIIQGNRETGARADLAGNREYSADRVEMKFSGKGDQTNTAAFKRWFAGSRVVDEAGKPLVVYHGTKNAPTVFEKSRTGMASTFLGDYEVERHGIFAAEDIGLAEEYANQGEKPTNQTVMPLYLSIENPLDTTSDGRGYTDAIWNGIESAAESMGAESPYRTARYIGDLWSRGELWKLFDADESNDPAWNIALLKKAGYDGMRIYERSEGDVENTAAWIAFDSTQIKSAIGNSGAFDPKNPDIRYSRSLITGQTLPTTWQAPDATKMDDFIYSMQDKHIDTKRVVKAVRDSIGALADQIDPYLQEELFHGRAAMDTKEFLEKEVRPLLTDLQGRGIDISDFEEYLHNRHAERRNVQVAKINPAMPDGGSGIQTQDARAYLAGLPQAKQTAYAALARRVDAISKQTRDLLVSSGLEKQETIDAWDAAYGSEYVPLMREEMDNGMGIGQGFSVRGSSSKRAMGSDKPVANIIANIALQREKAITRSEKRKIGEALYGMVLSAPNPDFWLAIDPALQQNPAQITATAIQLVGMGMNPADADSIAREPTQRYVSSITGMVEERINPALRSADNVLAVRIDGEDKYVFFNAKDDRAMRMAKSLKNLDSDQLGVVMGGVAKMTRYFSAISTQYNPIFGVTNIIRDVQTGMLNLQSTALKGHQKDVAKNILPALRGIYIDLRDHRAGKQPTSSYAQLFEEFQREGGATGFRDMYANAEERADKIRDEIADIGAGKLKQAGNGIMGWLSDYNESMENAVRVSAYKVAKEQGMSNQQAASLAKNLTTNFNRKGQVALQAGALFGFFNAATQGTARIAQTLTENGKLSSTGKNILKGGLLLGSMQALLLAGAGFDDEEPPDFVRERSLVIPIGDKKYVSIPMPLGFHIIPSLSRIPTEWALGGFKNTTKRIAQLAGLFADGLNPIGSSTLIQTMAPTVLDPIVALAENKDWTGKPIAKVDRDAMHPTAGHTRAKDTSTPWAKIISYGVNMATGGTDFKPGLASPTPDQIDYLIGQVTGGIGREVGKVAQVVGSGVSGEEIPLHKIPLVGRFVGSTEGQSAEASRFYNNLRTIGEHKVEIDGLRKNQRGSEISAYIKDNPDARLYQMADAVQRDVSKLNSLKRDLLKKDASPERIKLIDMKITSMMKLLNDRVRSMREMEPA